jgi:hypothetical protein
MSPQRKNQEASGAAIAAGGAGLAGTGLAAGGIPGAKSDSRPIFDLKPGRGGPVKRKVTAVTQNTKAAKAAKGGILGFRTHVHEGGTAGFQQQERQIATRSVAPGREASHAFSHGYTSGKIGPELKIIRQMKGGKKAAGAALVGGVGTTAYGLKRAKEQVEKAERHSDQFHGALIGAGGAGLGVGAGGRKVLRGQERKWRNRANTGIDEAQKLVPGLGGRKSDQNLRRYNKHLRRGGTPGDFPKTMRPEREMTDILRDKKVFHGVAPETAKKAGALRGGAAQAEHFSHVYGNTAKVVGRLRGPSALLAGAGVGGLAATKAQDKNQRLKKNFSTVSAFGVVH